MSFTDENLAELKELTKAIIYWSPKIPALIARLEASERYAWAQDPQNGPVNKEFVRKSKEEWRKSAGKSE